MHAAILVEERSAQKDLDGFLANWDRQYKAVMSKIDLFDQQKTAQWTQEQKQLFIKLLYHQRAHFDDVLWFMGNCAPTREAKEIILNNIRDELGMNGFSHEMLYLEFAKSFGVDLTYELLEEKYYYPFLKEYNQGHLRWLRDHDWSHRLSAFAAIERLDNLDYLALKELAVNIGAKSSALIFFNVHIYVKHYEETEPAFLKLWEEQSAIIEKVFGFIGDYQLAIWKRISDAIFKGCYLPTNS